MIGHKTVFAIFSEYFPKYVEESEKWFPNGKNSVRIRMKNKTEFIFTFENSRNWSFMTLDEYIKKMKGARTP